MPNGEITSHQLRTLGNLQKPYGDEQGVGDITSRANFQLRGIPLKDADMVVKAVQDCGLSSVMSGWPSKICFPPALHPTLYHIGFLQYNLYMQSWNLEELRFRFTLLLYLLDSDLQNCGS